MARHTHQQPEDRYLDLKALSARTCISIPTLREHIRRINNPLPCFRIGGKIYVRWPEFVEWTEHFRIKKHEELREIVNSVVRELRRKH